MLMCKLYISYFKRFQYAITDKLLFKTVSMFYELFSTAFKILKLILERSI